MTDFAAVDMAMSGFRLAWRRRRLMLAWAGLQLVFILLAFAVVLPIVFANMPADLESAAPTPPDLRTQLLLNAGVMPVSLALTVVLFAGVARSVLAPGRGGWANLRLGSDELWLLLSLLVVVLLLIPSYALLFLAIIGLPTLGNDGAFDPALLSVGVAAAAVVGIVTWWVGLRLSLVWPIAFHQHRIDLAQSWRLTRGRTLQLLWGWLIVVFLTMAAAIAFYLVALLVVLVLGALGAGVMAATGGFDAEQPSFWPRALLAFAPAALAYLLVSLWASAAYMAVLGAPAVFAYAKLTGAPLAPEVEPQAVTPPAAPAPG